MLFRSVVWLGVAVACAVTPLAVHSHPTFSSRSIVNAASFLPASSKGGAIARGAIFTIFGDEIGPGNGVVAVDFPLRRVLGGVSVLVSQPGAETVLALPLFVSNGQINAIMPSDAPLGAVTIQIRFNDGDGGELSSPVRAEVVEASFGIFTVTQRGVGPAVATNFEAADDQPLNGTTASARPGQTVVLWGTGLGAIEGGDDVQPGLADLREASQVEVWVGGVRAERVPYAGRSPLFAGLDQINFVVPARAAQGCYAPVRVKVAGERVSNVATLSIASEPGACVDPVNPYLGPSHGPRVGMALPQRLRFEAGSMQTEDDTASASFGEMVIREHFYNPALSLPPRGTCHLIFPTGSAPDGLAHERPASALEAGAPMVLRGPEGSREVTRTGAGYYESLLEGAFLAPGDYTLESAGGAGVAAFTHAFTIGEPPSWNALGGLRIQRDRPLTVEWTGGDPERELIRILGVVSSSELASVRVRATFVCTATPNQGFFEIPADVLSNLPASVGEGESSTARLYVGLSPLPETLRFEAAGLDFGAVVPVVMRGRPITVE